MSSTQGSTKNLGQGSQEAFRALVNSIAPETTPEKDGKLTQNAVEKISEKLKELVGDEAVKEFDHRRNERGELVNEEGLPIIEISEPIPQSEGENPQQQSTIHDVPLINLSSLPSVAREKLHQQRDKILDTLEKEERQEAERQERAEKEEREEILRKRKEEAANEKVKLQRAKELQKKMGKALMHNMGYSNQEVNYATEGGSSKKHEHTRSAADAEGRKKTVTFAETSEPTSTTGKPEWGDITAGKLRSGQQPTLLQSFRPDATPVKLNVIERKPAAPTLTTPSRATFVQSIKDSDDESEPEDNNQTPPSDGDESDEASPEELPDSEEDDGEVEVENEYDLDFAQHQREIALEYFNKRNIIGQDAAKAMRDHTHEGEFENESAPEVPAPNNQTKPSVSRFRANRIASAYGASTPNKPSTSIGDSVLPESTARTIQHAIRSGRIDDENHLVGGEHDSDSELEAEGLQETLELYRKGQVYNLGPDGQYLFDRSQLDPNITASASVEGLATTSSSTAAQQQGLHQQTLPPLNRPKTSKFKANRSQSGRPPTTSRAETPSIHTPPPTSSPAIATTVTERRPDRTQPENGRLQLSSSSSPPPMIINSPSFNAPNASRSGFNASILPAMPLVIESPSFPYRPGGPTQAAAMGNPATPFPSMIVDSPSFPPPSQRPPNRRPARPPTIVPSQNLNTQLTAKPVVAERPTANTTSSKNVRTEQNQAVATTVLERAPPSVKDTVPERVSEPAPEKVSRFKQSRNARS